jgi:hypothetical protein
LQTLKVAQTGDYRLVFWWSWFKERGFPA